MPLLRKAILVNSAEFICLGLGVFQTAVLSRILGPVGIGQYAVILSTLVLVGQLSSFGFPLSFLYHSQHDPDNTRVYLVNTIWSTLLLGIVGGIFLAALIYCKSSYFGEVSWFVLLAIIVYVPLMLQTYVARNHLLIHIEAKRLSIMSLAATAGAVLTILVLAWLGALSVGRAILCFILAMIIQASLGWFWMRGNVDFSIKPSWKINWKLGLMGVRQNWMDLTILFNAQLSILIIKYLLENFENVGYFSRGLQVAMLAVTAGQAVLPLLFSQWASFPKERLAAHVEKAMRFASSVGVIMIAVILLGAKQIVLLLYGKEFLPAITPMRILVPGAVLYLLSRTLIQLLASRGIPEMAVIMLFCGAAVNIVFCWLLIPVMGINGAALAAAIGHVVLLVSLVIIVKVKYGVTLGKCLVISKSDIRSIINSLRIRKTKGFEKTQG